MTEYTTREAWLNAFIEQARPTFAAASFPLPENVRVSVGFTSGGKRGKSIGEVWSDTASADGHYEIFLRPTMQTDARICDVLTHELCHVAAGLDAKHGKPFKVCCEAVGLVGVATAAGGQTFKATDAGQGWYTWALPILDRLGPLPYAELQEGQSSARPKQKTNLRKVECPACGWLARVTAKHITAHEHLNCPVPDCVGALLDMTDDEPEED